MKSTTKIINVYRNLNRENINEPTKFNFLTVFFCAIRPPVWLLSSSDTPLHETVSKLKLLKDFLHLKCLLFNYVIFCNHSLTLTFTINKTIETFWILNKMTQKKYLKKCYCLTNNRTLIMKRMIK